MRCALVRDWAMKESILKRLGECIRLHCEMHSCVTEFWKHLSRFRFLVLSTERPNSVLCVWGRILLDKVQLFCSNDLWPSADVFHLVSWSEVWSFIHSGFFYSTSSSRPLLLRGAPDTARILCRSFTLKRHIQLRVKDLPKVPMMQLERDSNPRSFGRRASNLPMSHHSFSEASL